jgi:hypothetical protein
MVLTELAKQIRETLQNDKWFIWKI